MRALAGIVVMLGMMLTACDTMPPTDPALQETATLPEEHAGTQEAALTQGDCTASIYCGNWATCSGAAGQCSVNPAGFGSVTCTNSSGTTTTTHCNPIIQPTCGCGQDGCCSEVCARDPDCGTCVAGRSCTSDSQCGGTMTGRCNAVTKKCSCLILQ